MSDINFETFPDDKVSALTMLYLQNQNITELSPEELFAKYEETYEKIKACHKEARKNKSVKVLR